MSIDLDHTPERLWVFDADNYTNIKVVWGDEGDRKFAFVVKEEFMQLMCFYAKTFGTPSKMGCRGMSILPKNNEVFNDTDWNIIEFFGEKDIKMNISTETLLLLADRVRHDRYENSFLFRLKCAFQPNRYY